MRPITIIGGGLAGLGLANGLAREGVDVTVREAGDYPRHRVCGEFLCGRGAAALETLGLGEALAEARRHRDVGWFRKGRLARRHELPETAYGLSRYALDARLAARFEARGGNLRRRSRAAPEETGEGRVDAAGRAPAKSDWIGLKCHARDLPTRRDLELHFGDQGYVGLCAVEGGRTNICGLFRKRPGLKAKRGGWLDAYLRAAGMAGLADRLASGDVDPESHCGTAGVVFAAPPALDGAPRLGDRFSAIPPFTGNGMSLALESASLAVEPVADYAAGRLPWDGLARALDDRLAAAFRARLRAAGRLHPWLVASARQKVLLAAAKARLLPFRRLYRATH